jgi:hypothetical protein
MFSSVQGLAAEQRRSFVIHAGEWFIQSGDKERRLKSENR